MPIYGLYRDRDALALAIHQAVCVDARTSPQKCSRGDIYLVADKVLRNLRSLYWQVTPTLTVPGTSANANARDVFDPDRHSIRAYFTTDGPDD